MFHDCFIHGCDGSILLKSTGNKDKKAEMLARASVTLKGFEVVDQIKEELESQCPEIVSCSDILVLATRATVNVSGGPYFLVPMGRRDSKDSYIELAEEEIPWPNGNISETLRLFTQRHFSHRETVALLGVHNIRKMDCQFITPRFKNFEKTASRTPHCHQNFKLS